MRDGSGLTEGFAEKDLGDQASGTLQGDDLHSERRGLWDQPGTVASG